MSKSYISAVQTNDIRGLCPGRTVFTVFDPIGPIQFHVEWLDPAITNGCLIMEVGDLRKTQSIGSPDMIADLLLMTLTTVRDYVIAKVGAGDIRSDCIEWQFERCTLDFIAQYRELEFNVDARMDDTFRVDYTQQIFRENETVPGDFQMLEMARVGRQ